MERSAETLVLAILLISTAIVLVKCENEGEDSSFVECELNLRHRKQKVSQLHFYLYDNPAGSNPTAVPIAKAAMTEKSATQFGLLAVADDPLTVGAEQTSKLIGRAQGMYASDSKQEWNLLLAMHYTFIEGKYNGSSISVLGMNHVSTQDRELTVVGGTGIFRMARGYAMTKAIYNNFTTGEALIQYNVTVFHY
uniref:Dirigent protein n=1 Tax=Kadsura heteroclita TaxID=124781 RepID=A0A7U3VI69_9MAGN|nr:dirigent protein 26 [Kadsura heteroclita]